LGQNVLVIFFKRPYSLQRRTIFGYGVLSTHCLEAVTTAADWGMGRVHIETDCANPFTALRGTEYDLAPEGVLFQEIRLFASLNFMSFKISFCSRLCNKVGHTLAALGANQTMPRRLWVDSELTEPV
jgi:hypothetical protein